MLTLLALLSPLVLPQDPVPAAEPAPVTVTLTYLANEGFLLRGTRGSVLIDAFTSDDSGDYEALTPEALRALKNGESPFDSRIFALVSHLHPDHFQARIMERFLASNELAQLIASPSIAKRMRDRAKNVAGVEDRIREVEVAEGEVHRFDGDDLGINIEVFLLPHVGESPPVTENVGHLIEIEGVKILHVGDAAPNPDSFRPYDFAARGIDVAIVPYWFYATDSGLVVLDELIAADHVAVCHFPLSGRSDLIEQMRAANQHAMLFDKPFDTKAISAGDADGSR